MFINKDALTIDSTNMANYISEVEYGYNKAWGTDSGRNMKASMSGTFLGIIVKLRLKVKPLTQTELETISPIFNKPWQSTTYYDPDLKRLNTIDTYTGDWATLNKNTFTNVARANESFTISVIAVNPREVD